MINTELVNEHLQKSRLPENNLDVGMKRSNAVARMALDKLLASKSVDTAIRELEMDVISSRMMSFSLLAGAIESDAVSWLKSRTSIYESA